MKHLGELLMPRSLHRPMERKPPKLAVVLVDMNYPKDDIKPLRGTTEESISRHCKLLETARRLSIPIVLMEDAHVVLSTYKEIKAAAGQGVTHLMKWEYSAFKTELFLDFLDRTKANTLVLIGYEMNICLRGTADDALRLGYGLMTSPELLLYRTLGKYGTPEMVKNGAAFYRKETDHYRTTEKLLSAMERIVGNGTACAPATN